MQQMFDPPAPWGILGYEKAIYLEELTDGAIGVIVDRQPHKKSPMSFMPILCLGGAAAAQPDHAIAFGGRRSTRYVVNLAAIAQTSEDLQTRSPVGARLLVRPIFGGPFSLRSVR
jgi:hypothetical protein